MRLNKKKLAALAMSAVMAASTMPFPVLAEEFTDGTETPVVEQAEVVAYDGDTTDTTAKPYEGKIAWKYADGKGTASYAGVDENGNSITVTIPATVKEEKKADCENDGWVVLTVDIGKVSYDSDRISTDKKLGHKWVEQDKVTVSKPATCTENGSGTRKYICELDNNHVKEEPITIPATGHKYVSKIISYTEGYNTKIVDGVPQLINPSRDGIYYENVEKTCSVCGDVKTETNQKTLYADQVDYFTIANIDNIAAGQFLPVYTVDTLQDIKDDELELIDCTKDGKYEILAHFVGKTDTVSYKKVTVEAHHTEVTAYRFLSDEDEALIKIDKDGNVTNTSCWKDITYYEYKYCKVDKCKYKTPEVEKVAEHKGIHNVTTSLEETFKAEINKNGYADYTKLKKIADANKKSVKLSKNTATCTEDGTATITFLCNVCGQEAGSITVKTVKLGHSYKDLVDESSVVEATCEKRGSYDIVTKCERCGEIKANTERRTVYTNRLMHTNEAVITNSGTVLTWKGDFTNSYIKFVGDKVIDKNGNLLKQKGKAYTTDNQWASMGAEFYTNCDVCHNNEHKVDSVVPSIKIVDIAKESASGAAGYIKLEASKEITTPEFVKKTISNEITVPYFSSALAYAGRTESEELNGLHEDKDGVYRYYVNGKFDNTYYGIVKYAGREYLVVDGLISESTNGVTLVEGTDTFYFLANGCVQRGYTGVTIYDGQSFYLNNGVVDTDINGLVPYNGGTFLFAAGRLVKEHNGLWQDFDGSWYFLALGQVQTQYTGVAEYDGAYFYVKNGKLDTTKNGTITVDGVKYTAVDGQLYK